jgi:hypothetical protein
MPDEVMHKLSHGDPLAALRYEEGHREDWDVGVRFCSWGPSRDMLVTGSSDGVVKTWDIFRNDPHTSDLISLNSGVTSAAFSPDFTTLIVGEINRTVTVMDVGNHGRSITNLPRFDFIRASKPESTTSSQPDHDIGQIKTTRRPSRLPGVGEVTDSHRSEDRIPTQLMANLSISDNEDDGVHDKQRGRRDVAMNMAKKICAHCGAAARPGDADQREFPLCERCGFSCFRCGERIKLNPRSQTVKCKDCELEWDIGALGYHRKGQSQSNKEKRIPTAHESVDMEGTESLAFVGDIVEEDYAEFYHSLWDY